jgi:small-conductance mechanosensitive channel
MAFVDILTTQYGDNMGRDYLFASLSFLVFIVVLYIFKAVIIHRLKRLAKKTKTEFDDIIINFLNKLHWPFYVILSLFISLRFLIVPEFVTKALDHILIIFVAFYAVRFVQVMLDFGAKHVKEKYKEGDEDLTSKIDIDVPVIDVLNKIIKGVLWGVAIIVVLSNFGYNVSTLAAGLGIGGIAIAFALQAVLGDIFASFSIYFDKPFRVGDFIIIGDDLGTVKHIGIKTTRIQTLQGQELIVSNKELTETRVNNYKRMEKRRIVFTFGVEYSTPLKKLKKINGIVKDVIGKIKIAELNRVHFKQFGDFSLNFEVVYYVNIGDYNVYMDTQQQINFGLKEEFEKEGIVFAFPTQTLFVNKVT